MCCKAHIYTVMDGHPFYLTKLHWGRQFIGMVSVGQYINPYSYPG